VHAIRFDLRAVPRARDVLQEEGGIGCERAFAEARSIGTRADSQGAAWTGWTVKAPADAKAEPNEGTFPHAIAIRWGNGAGAMGFVQGKTNFASVKHDFTVTGDTKVTNETPDRLDATMTMAGHDLKGFYQKRKVGDVEVTCWTVSFVESDADLAAAHAICESLSK
jgi:hypothetical protein